MTEIIHNRIDRRDFLKLAACGVGVALAGIGPFTARAARGVHVREIPSSGEKIPAVGMGTWVTFNVGEDRELLEQRTEIMRVFFEQGGGMIDCSPMYGTSADTIGYGLARLEDTGGLFSAEKVWRSFMSGAGEQIDEQRKRWGVKKFDLVQVHNLYNKDEYIEVLKEQKERGEIRYIGATTSHGRRHGEMESFMQREPLDFVQFSYNIINREAEKRLLPLAAERGIAVIANRPFMHDELFRRFENKPLPEWAGEIGAANWAQFFLKFIISHPHVTCAIPATSRVDHVRENMGALHGPLPDEAMRARMVKYVEAL